MTITSQSAAGGPTAQPIGAAPAEPGTAEPSVGQLVADATQSLSALIHGEIELAKLEVTSSVKNAGTGIGLFAGAGVLLVFSLTFLFVAGAEGLVALGLPRSLSYLIVFAVLALVAGLLAFLGIKKVKRVRAPERTIAVSKDTVAYLKANTKRS